MQFPSHCIKALYAVEVKVSELIHFLIFNMPSVLKFYIANMAFLFSLFFL